MAFKLSVTICVLLLAACTGKDSAQTRLDNYLSRLSNAIEIKPPDNNISTQPLLVYPERRVRINAVSQAENTINLLEFLKLDQCQVGQVIANKNSSLGKVASNSQALIYSIDFIRLAPQCIEQLNNDEQSHLAESLEQSYLSKLRNLNQQAWLAILGENEYRDFWHLPNSVNDYPINAANEQMQALRHVNSFSEKLNQATLELTDSDYKNIENALAALRINEGGYLLKSYQLLQTALLNGNQLLQAAIDKPFCFDNYRNPRRDIFQNVINKYFIQDIQTWAAKLNRRKQTLFTEISALENNLINNNAEEFNQWLQQRNAIFEKTDAALKQHVKLIQQLYQQCQLQAGNR